tara:strand:- start:260 stop:1504 length:1245 start_codon:yes stop_codon:yes gene_type:complete
MSKIEVNEIVKSSGSTLTLGGSGTAVTLGSGATQTGFGRTGTVDWVTTKKTGDFTAVSGEGYFIDTSSSTITMTLPASPTAGSIVAINDYARNFATNNLTVNRNSSNIQGVADNATLQTNGQSTMFVYVDATKGWIPTEDQTTNNYGTTYITATGGTITEDGDFKVHTFTGPGTFTVSSVGNPGGSTTADYLIVAGGGSGAPDDGGGGGAGGMRFSATTYTSPSPLKAPTAFTVSATGYPVVVGAGGAGTSRPPYGPNGNAGSNSSVFSLTSAGGGFGASNSPATTRNGGSGGSGGGSSGPSCGGAGNTPPVSPPQGNNGGSGPQGSGGGGIGGVGANGTGSGGCGNAGGAGLALAITGSCVTYSEGGRGDIGTTPSSNEPANSGNGSDGICAGSGGTGSGGSGIVVIRYKFQN